MEEKGKFKTVDADKVTVHWNNLNVHELENIVKRVENILEVMERNNMGVLGYAKLLAKIEKDPKSANFSVENFKEEIANTLSESGVDNIIMLMEDLQKHYMSRACAGRLRRELLEGDAR